MPQTVFGQSDALALNIVDWLNSGTAWQGGNFCVPIAAERVFARKKDLPNIPAFDQPVSVDVIPGAVLKKRESIHVFAGHYGINIFVQQYVAGAADPEAQCALLAQLQTQIVEAVALYPFSIPNAVHSLESNQLAFVESRSGDRGLYDLLRLETDNIFESDTILIFKAAA